MADAAAAEAKAAKDKAAAEAKAARDAAAALERKKKEAKLIKLPSTGKCLDSYEQKNGGDVHMWDCDPNNRNQHWSYDEETKLVRGPHGRCLDLGGHNGEVHMWDCDEKNINQHAFVLNPLLQEGVVLFRQPRALQYPPHISAPEVLFQKFLLQGT